VGRLSGFRYRDIVRRLRGFGFEFHRHAAGSHEIWRNPVTGRFTTIPNHTGDMPEGTLRAILRQAGIEPDEFLGKN
jgi:predicted RNA binding protein YcfA (HicA-like mRNA interferase family)